MKLIKREKYLNELIDLTGTPDIKVITGVRRSGKSVLLHQYAEYVKQSEEKVNIISVNLQELEYDFLLDYHKLHEFIDFVAIKRNQRIYIQVSDNVSDEKTLNREISPLLQTKDAYPKMVIARTRYENYQNEGVLITDISNWLLSKRSQG